MNKSLSELINLCGNNFLGLHRLADNKWTAYEGIWIDGKMGIHTDVTSDTPERALEHLLQIINNYK